jgi:hypothetical protein
MTGKESDEETFSLLLRLRLFLGPKSGLPNPIKSWAERTRR